MRALVPGTRAAGVTAALAILGIAWPGAAAAQCGQDYHQAPTHSYIPGGPPLAIGDSVLADAVPELARDGFEADGMVCRQMSQGIALLEARAASLPHLIVLALGTNGEVSAAQIGRVLAILGPSRLLALVTPFGSVVPSTPEVIRAEAQSHPGRIVLLDWDRLAAAHPQWLAPDGVHLGSAAGITAFAQLIANALPYAVAAAPAQPRESSPPPLAIRPRAEQHHTATEHRRPAAGRRAGAQHRTPTKDRPASDATRSAGHGVSSTASTAAAQVSPAPTRVSPTPILASSKPRDSSTSALVAPLLGAAALLLLASLALARRRWRR